MNVLVDVFLLFARLSLVAFGAGGTVLAEMEREAVARGWMDHAQFVQSYAASQVTPGPQLLFVGIVGYDAAGFAGALAAVLGFFLPPGLLGLAIAPIWARAERAPWTDAIRRALGPVSMGLMASGVYGFGHSALTNWWTIAIGVVGLAWLLSRWSRGPLWVVGMAAVAGAAASQVGG